MRPACKLPAGRMQPACRLHVESVMLQRQKLKYIWLCLHIVANSETDTFVITGLLVTHLRTIYLLTYLLIKILFHCCTDCTLQTLQ